MDTDVFPFWAPPFLPVNTSPSLAQVFGYSPANAGDSALLGLVELRVT